MADGSERARERSPAFLGPIGDADPPEIASKLAGLNYLGSDDLLGLAVAENPRDADLLGKFAELDADVAGRLLEFEEQLSSLERSVDEEFAPAPYPDVYDARILELLRKV